MKEILSDDTILVLTTRERNWWWSMQEIIPALESVWVAIGQSERENVRMLCAPLEPEVEQNLLACASKLKRIVMTTVTPETERIALLLRQQMKVVAPMIIYLSGDATEGFDSFTTLTNTLTESDVFVVCSEADAAATRFCFPNAQVRVIPFPLMDQFKVNGSERVTRLDSARLVYVGRVSEQKNLHTLLFALWILRNYFGHPSRITLDVYGSVDNLGSPNIGLKFPNYDKYLQELAEVLSIDNLVTWHGFKSRDWLFDNVHQKPHIFVSPTLHSDENFGSSVLASLANGYQVVTTAWGGHFEFVKWFPKQLLLVPVYRSIMGPVVDPVMLANTILRAISEMLSIDVEDTALQRGCAEFSVSSVAVRTVDLLNQPLGGAGSVKKSPTLQLIDQRRFLGGGRSKIYENYADPVAHIFFEAYGMKEKLTFQEQSSYILPPWTNYSEQVLRIDDPHRGHQSFNIDANFSEPFDIRICPSINTYRLPKSLVRNLFTRGYAFLLPSVDSSELKSLYGLQGGSDQAILAARWLSDEEVADA